MCTTQNTYAGLNYRIWTWIAPYISWYLFYVYLRFTHLSSSVINEHKHMTQTEMCDEKNFNTENLISVAYIKYINFKYIKDIIKQHKTRNKIKHKISQIS